MVAVYHPKPPARVNDASSIRRIGAGLGYRGELAVDADWSELKRLLGADDDGRATSVSVLVDGAGVIRFVHPGPVLFPSEDPAHRRENADFQALEQAVRTLVSGDSGRSPDRLPSS